MVAPTVIDLHCLTMNGARMPGDIAEMATYEKEKNPSSKNGLIERGLRMSNVFLTARR